MSIRIRTIPLSVAVLRGIAMAALLLPAPAPADRGDCGQPISRGNRPASVDALVALKTSVALQHCGDDEDDCECDVDDSGVVTPRDSLSVLRAAVGFGDQLNCDPECGAPGSTLPGVTSTTLDDDDDDDDVDDDDQGEDEDGDEDDGDNDDGDDDDGDDDDGGEDDDDDDDDTTTTTTAPL